MKVFVTRTKKGTQKPLFEASVDTVGIQKMKAMGLYAWFLIWAVQLSICMV